VILGAVHVTMLELLRGGIPDPDYRYLEVQGRTGQRVIGIHRDRIVVDLDHRDHLDPGFGLLFGLPVLLLGSGIVTWYRRRRR
jgi:hypothetical protein